MASRPKVMKTKITKSFIINPKGAPCIISLRMASIYHLAGTIADTGCSTAGMFSMGNIMPESITMGMSITAADTSNATTWVLATVDTSSPSDSDSTRYTSDTIIIEAKLPVRGISSM